MDFHRYDISTYFGFHSYDTSNSLGQERVLIKELMVYGSCFDHFCVCVF